MIVFASLNQTRIRIWMKKRLPSNQKGFEDQSNA